MGTEDYKDIIDVLKAIQEISCVQPSIPKAPNKEATTPVTVAT